MFLAVDAGGTSTRAVVVDRAGHVLGYGRAAGGNPTSAGIARGRGGDRGRGRAGGRRAAAERGRVRGHRHGRGEDRGVHGPGVRAPRPARPGPRGAATRPAGHVRLGDLPARRVRPDRRHRQHRRADPGRCAAPGGRRPRLAARRRRQRLLDRAPGGAGGGVRAGRPGTADRADAAGADGAGDQHRGFGSQRCRSWCPRCTRGARSSCRSSPRSPSPLPTIRSPGRFSTGPPRRWPICWPPSASRR